MNKEIFWSNNFHCLIDHIIIYISFKKDCSIWNLSKFLNCKCFKWPVKKVIYKSNNYERPPGFKWQFYNRRMQIDFAVFFFNPLSSLALTHTWLGLTCKTLLLACSHWSSSLASTSHMCTGFCVFYYEVIRLIEL